MDFKLSTAAADSHFKYLGGLQVMASDFGVAGELSYSGLAFVPPSDIIAPSVRPGGTPAGGYRCLHPLFLASQGRVTMVAVPSGR